MPRRVQMLMTLAAVGVAGAGPGVAAARTWTLVSVPAPSGVSSSALAAVSCPSASACMAVGTWEAPSSKAPGFTDKPFFERWNGTGWTLANMPAPTGANVVTMTGISCTSASACTSVGYALGYQACTPGNCPSSATAFAERWNVRGWKVQALPNPSAQTRLLGVTCTSASSCTAVGKYFTGQYDAPLAERWNGSTWSTLGQPTPPGGWFAGVSCPSAAACIAAGENNGHPLAEAWNGTAWTPQLTPDPASTSGGTPTFTAVSCSSTTVCSAVGNDSTFSTSGPQPHPVGNAFAEQLSGGNVWHVQSIANPAGATDTQLAAISWHSGSQCTAVGGYFTSADLEYTAAADWNGTAWATEKPPNPSGSPESFLSGVSCTSASACTAVGTAATGPNGTGSVLVERTS